MVGLPVAMGNSPPQLKAVAEAVTLSDDVEGVAWLLERCVHG